ncbi:MAG TPA: hypothetical protein DEP66_04930, partial [Acidimicrobiaceae bacterium]|nr:hypothetical protein [Acidimicrobiaceae bacterium]
MGLGPPLTARQVEHLRRLMLWWTLMADLSFSDLLLFLRASAHDVEQFVIAGQVRAGTGRTLYRDDHVGVLVSGDERPFVAAALAKGTIQTGEVRLVPTRAQALVMSIPVLCDGEVIAALSREVAPDFADRPDFGNLERNYLDAFVALADMVAAGEFPYPVDDGRPVDPLEHDDDFEHGEVPRVGDGMMVVNGDDEVTFASPNAVNALHRTGVLGNIEGRRLDEVGMAEGKLAPPRPAAAPVTTDLERNDAVVQVTALPLGVPVAGRGA